MTEREVQVIHLLMALRGQGEPRWLFFRHDRWRTSDGRSPMLAMPTKKVQPHGRESPSSSRGAYRALTSVWRFDLGGPGPQPAGRRLPEVATVLRSPTHGVTTTYHIVPLAMPVAADKVARASRLGGEWLTTGEAVSRRDLSPTARVVLAHLHDLAGRKQENLAEALFGTTAATDEWTHRLGEARWDVRIFGELFKELRPWLVERLGRHSTTRELCRVPADVDDALSDAAMNALMALSTFDPAVGNAKGWLWVITRNAAVSVLRDRRRHGAVRLEGDEPHLAVARSNDDPAALAERMEWVHELQRRLSEALAKVPPAVQRAWHLYHAEGLTYAAAAKAVGVPIGTLASCFYRIRQAMQE
jgi:RNA polymerase sigma-70 factor (ECF subfamily)